MSTIKLISKSLMTSRFLLFMAASMSFIMLLLYFMAGPKVAQAKGFGYGQTFGSLDTINRLVGSLAENARKDPSSTLTDLATVDATLKEIQADALKRSKNGAIIPLIDGLEKSISSYEVELKANRTAEARLVLTNGVASSNQALSTAMVKANEKVKDELESAPAIAKMSQGFFAFFVLVGILAGVTFAQGLTKTGQNWKIESLEKRIEMPILASMGNYVAKQAKAANDERTAAAVSSIVIGGILKPDLENFLKEERITLGMDHHDLADELQFVNSYLYFMSEGKTPELNFPAGACMIVCRRSVIGYTFVHWIEHLRRELKVEDITLAFAVQNGMWRISIETQNAEIHENAYQQVAKAMADKHGVDKDHAESIDLVRTTLRRLAKNVETSFTDGNIRLDVDFENMPKPKDSL